ncbi:MAG: NUDIX hydrolase [Ilumatobacteraceae bacterium]
MSTGSGQIDPGDELVDVVDESDVIIATVTRREMRKTRLRHRAVFIAVTHPDGRILVHRRSDTKDLWPGWWDMAVGGVVAAGETYDDAARRELAEEIGVTGVVPEPVGGGRYDDDQVHLVGRCYRVTHAGPFSFNDGEVVETTWMTIEELRDAIARRPFLPDSVALFADTFRLI